MATTRPPRPAGWPRQSGACSDSQGWWGARSRSRAEIAVPPGRFRGSGQACRRFHRSWTRSTGASMRSGGRFDIDRKRARVELIERESVQPGFWEDQKRAQALSREKSGLELQIAQYERERQRLDDAIALHELAEEANDAATREEAK